MKKSIISIILIMLFMLTFASCETDSVDGDTTAGSTENQGTSEAASGEEDSTDTQTGNEGPAFGLLPSETRVELIKKDESLYVNADTALSLPVISDPYPMGHGGAEFTVDDSVKEKLEDNVKRYYELLGSEYEPEDWSFDEELGRLIKAASDEYMSFYVGPELITFVNRGDKYSIDMSEEEILMLFTSDPYIRAMVEFAGITEPVLHIDVTKSGNSSELNAKLYNDADSISEKIVNSQLNYVCIRINENSDICYFYCHTVDIDRTVEVSSDLLTYEAAVASLSENDTVIASEIVYSSEFEKDYYVPCFVFYTENTDEKSEDGVIVNKTFVPMYSFAESAE